MALSWRRCRVAPLMGSEPRCGALLAMGWLAERMAPPVWLGSLLIVGAVPQVTLPKRALSPGAA